MSDEKKTISVAYRPQPGDDDTTEAFGRKFKAGEFVELDPEFADRARANPSFEVKGEKSFGDEIKEERQDEDEGEDLSFDEAVELERVQEYGTTDEDVAEEIRKNRQYGGNIAPMGRGEALAVVERKRRGRPRKDDTPPVDDEAAARAAQVEADHAEVERQQEAERDAEAQRQARLEAARAAEANA